MIHHTFIRQKDCDGLIDNHLYRLSQCFVARYDGTPTYIRRGQFCLARLREK